MPKPKKSIPPLPLLSSSFGSPIPVPIVSPSSKPKYLVVKDTREKAGMGWTFKESARCRGMIRCGLPTGDYSLKGYEHVVAIERKGSVGEFAQNICQDRFWRELERMRAFPVAALILEFTIEDVMKWPSGSGIPQWKWPSIRTTPKFILSRIKKIETDYPNIEVVLAGDAGQAMARKLFEKALRHGKNASRKG